MNPPLPKLIRTGDRVLVKPFLRYGYATPESRMVSHPEMVRMVIEAATDCGAITSLGDAGMTKGGRRGSRPLDAWIHDVARQSGASLASFGESGARYLRSGVLFPRRYLISRAVLDADKVIGCANLQPHPLLTLSGATKNMFNSVVGKCQQQLHDLFPSPDAIARIIVDVCSLVKPTVSFLDLTTVAGPDQGSQLKKVGLILAGSDPIALDAVGARLVGDMPHDIPTIRIGSRSGLGISDAARIMISGPDWKESPTVPAQERPVPHQVGESLYDSATRFVNNVFLNRTPFVDPLACTRCGACRQICPVEAVTLGAAGIPRIDARKCANCQLCIESCDPRAIDLRYGRVAVAIRGLVKRSPQM
jgi:uncharacterized protein (DUF362 family)/Pyruvate/2-oxoacid:ferredoxin oxidoreductase delta subunit